MIALASAVLLQASVPPETIIVTARRAQTELAECLARSCPPGEEIDAALDAAVEQFAAGDYLNARRTLSRALSRNRRHATDHPELVSSLYATRGTVERHLGQNHRFRINTLTSASVLRKHLGEGETATIRADLDAGDMFAQLNQDRVAMGVYRRAQRAAAAAGHVRLAAMAAVRRSWLTLNRRDYSDAEAYADEAVAIAGPNDRVVTDLRAILRTRILIAKGDPDAIDALVRQLRTSPSAPIVMAHAPPYQLTEMVVGGTGIDWADIGFWVRPDGRTESADVLRAGAGDNQSWTPPILRQIGARRYLPIALEPGHPGIYRIERFTFRAPYAMPSGSRIMGRVGAPELIVADLTHLGEPQTNSVVSP